MSQKQCRSAPDKKSSSASARPRRDFLHTAWKKRLPGQSYPIRYVRGIRLNAHSDHCAQVSAPLAVSCLLERQTRFLALNGVSMARSVIKGTNGVLFQVLLANLTQNLVYLTRVCIIEYAWINTKLREMGDDNLINCTLTPKEHMPTLSIT